MPRHIRIVEEIPLTSVGKIYKPALKRKEMVEAMADALRQAAVPVADISVTETSGHGNRVTVTLAEEADEEAARAVLGRFPFLFDTPACLKRIFTGFGMEAWSGA